MRYPLALLLILLAPVLCCAQIMWPGGGMTLGGKQRTITGHIGGIDPGKNMVRLLESRNVLFTVDEKTKIHVDKTPLTLADLKEDDAVAVRLKEIKNQGPYALEIMAHPDVLARKQRGGTPDAAPSATELPASLPAEKPEASGPPVKVGSAPAPAPSNAAPQRGVSSSAGSPSIPSLPRGQSGITGTIVAAATESTLQM